MARLVYTVSLLFISCSYILAQWTDAYIPDFKVNDDNLNSYQILSSIGVDSAGNFVIAWTDSRMWPGQNYPWQVYCQRYTRDGNPIGVNFRIGQDTASAPEIAIMPNGKFVIVWATYPLGLSRIDLSYQRFDRNANPLGQAARVMDTVPYSFWGFSVGIDSMGKFIVSWSARFQGPGFPSVYFQRYDSSGNRIGTAQLVNEVPRRAEQPDIAVNKDGSFVICWQDDRHTPAAPIRYDIFMQRYNSNGIKIGNNVKVNDDNDSTKDQLLPSVSTNGSGNIVISWGDERNSPPIVSQIYYQLFDSLGTSIGVNRRADGGSGFGGVGTPHSAMRPDRKFFLGWSDWNYAGREQFYGRRFDSLGNSIGNPYMVPMSSPGSSIQRGDAVFILGDRVYSAWTDNRNGGSVNYDIYCNVRGFQNPDTVIGIINTNEIVRGFRLYPAYPNPFNSSSKFKVQSSKLSYVKLSLYNVIGQEIMVLLDGILEGGIFEFEVNGSLLTSGIYLVEMRGESGFSEVQRIVLVK